VHIVVDSQIFVEKIIFSVKVHKDISNKDISHMSVFGNSELAATLNGKEHI
jgi:hypothetical protein